MADLKSAMKHRGLSLSLLLVGLLVAPLIVVWLAGDERADPTCDPQWQAAATADAPVWTAPFSFLTGNGEYRARTHCLVTATGEPDWPWIAALVVVNLLVIAGYARIFIFWRRSYLAEAPEDRNGKLMDLAYIFLWCAVCGYVLAVLTFIWPAYRLAVVCLGVLAFFTWKFIWSLGDLQISLSAIRYKRELRETLEARTRELERLVEERTAELEEARRVAEAASGAKSRFLAHMSHEIRTPMTAILGYSDMVIDHHRDPSVVLDAGQTIRRNARHLLGVINDILDLSKIEAGKIEYESIPVAPVNVARDAMAFLARTASEKDLELTGELLTPVPAVVKTDPTRLRQILINLIGNAVKFTGAGSIRVEIAYRDERLSIGVRDTGVGMDEDQLARLFKAFSQGDDSTTRRFGGTGLGLAISRRFARGLGGDLTASSAPGEGSLFTLEIHAPATDEAPMTPAGPLPVEWSDLTVVERHDATLTGRVLLVEDGPDNQRLIGHLLRLAGADVAIAADGREALAAVEVDGPFDLILMDMQMPVMDGYEATRELRRAGYDRPILALTAHAMREELERCLEAGCDDTASKPIDRTAMLELCRRWIAAGAAA